MSSFTVKNIDLKKLDFNDPLWEEIISLTVKGWRAETEFYEIKLGLHGDTKMKFRLVFSGNKPVAWGYRAVYDPGEEPILWLYTHPNYRGMGIQSNLIIPYFNKLGGKYAVWMESEVQKKTFSKLRKKFDVSGIIPVDLSV